LRIGVALEPTPDSWPVFAERIEGKPLAVHVRAGGDPRGVVAGVGLLG